MKKPRIVFISTMTGAPWGGSECLWSETARYLAARGTPVSASVVRWPTTHPKIAALLQSGIPVYARWAACASPRSRWLRVNIEKSVGPLLRRLSALCFRHWVRRQHPDLLCVSNGTISDPSGVMRLVASMGIPYVLIAQANATQHWPDDAAAAELIEIYSRARRICFVSRNNLTLAESQLGVALPNAEVVRNPVNVSRDARASWPTSEGLRLACVARLTPDAKGQDLVLEVLAQEPWRSRPVTVSFFGSGSSEAGLRRLASRLGVADRVRFHGHVDRVESIWETHQALLLASRYEGLPLALVEAMLCGRPAIVTDVGGNAEVVQDGITGFIAEAPTVDHLAAALERAWQNRERLESMGRSAAAAIRASVPADPAAVFAEQLLQVAGTALPEVGRAELTHLISPAAAVPPGEA